MGFGVNRAAMLELLAEAMEVPVSRRPAFLGRFQHLQRLSLIEGISPGRGKAAEYQAHHVMVIALALQMLQLGLTPERAVETINQNRARVREAIGLAVSREGNISPSLFWFDPSVLTKFMDESEFSDLAEATFDFGDAEESMRMFKHFFVDGYLQRSAFISVSGTLWHIVGVLDGFEEGKIRPKIAEQSLKLLAALSEWFDSSDPAWTDG
ncbi:hypothetical protein [Sphingopyxis granuli]|uniref:hypothetical protein n=1 Tax=Sphingopyxis granuli TaxID=267128 RepID=UPI001BAEA180|nr:hypothetical protein [Sphingopyxis granuli]QUM70858.1 hypothetical protein ICN83_10630 [Sphingopyxis granuli]